MKTILLSVFLTLIWASTGFANDWISYKNTRFGTSVNIPRKGFIAKTAAQNRDSRAWQSLDGRMQIQVFGKLMATAGTFRQYRKDVINLAKENGVDVTHNAGKKGWFIFSGYKGSDAFYEKVVLTAGCPRPIVNHVYLRFPMAQKKYYDRLVRRVLASLRGTRSGTECQP